MIPYSWISGRWAAASAAQIPFPARSHLPCTQKNDRAFVSKRKNSHSPIRSPKKVGKSLVPHTSYVGRRRANGREGGAARAANIMERGSRIVKRPRLDLHSGEGGWTHGRREDAADGDVLAPLSSHFAALSPNVQIISIPFQYQNPEGSNRCRFIFLVCYDMTWRLPMPCRRPYRNIRFQVSLPGRPFIRRYKCCRHQVYIEAVTYFPLEREKSSLIIPYK